jgi:hypothetical protein
VATAVDPRSPDLAAVAVDALVIVAARARPMVPHYQGCLSARLLRCSDDCGLDGDVEPRLVLGTLTLRPISCALVHRGCYSLRFGFSTLMETLVSRLDIDGSDVLGSYRLEVMVEAVVRRCKSTGTMEKRTDP